MEYFSGKKFYIKYSKFSKIYISYPIFFYFYLQSDEFTPSEITSGILVATIVSILLSHLFFEFWIKKNWVLTLFDEEVETFNMLGTKRRFQYKDLNPPMINGYLGIVKLALFTLKSDYKKSMAITDWIEGFTQCIEFVEKKRRYYDVETESDNSKYKEMLEDIKNAEEKKKKGLSWDTTFFIFGILLFIYIKLQFFG